MMATASLVSRRKVCTACMVLMGAGGTAFGLEVGRYDTFETSLMNYTYYSNPFQNVTLSATLTSPSFQNTTVRGFYDGNNTWRVRFMPDQTGAWSYTCTFSDGAPGASGSFQCVPSNLHGPLRTDPATPLWFRHADGTPFYLRAFHLWRPESFTEPVLESTLDFMKLHGMNVVDGPHLANWGTAGDQIPWEGSDYTYYKLRVWQELDVCIRQCAERGITVFPFSILGGTNGIPKMPTWDQRQRFLQYWVARWGGFWNVAFCPVSEYAEAYSTAEAVQILNEIYGADGGKHPVSIHPGNTYAEPPTEIKTMGAYTHHTIQDKLADWNPLRYQQLVGLYNIADKPMYAQETLWEGNLYQPDSSRDMNNMRKAAWVTATNGGQISYADQCLPGHLPQNRDETATYSMEGAAVEPQGWFYPYLAHLGDFMESVPFWRMSLQPALASTGNCLAKAGYWYVAYTLGGSFTVDLTGATEALVGRWYDPRDGGFGPPFAISPGGVRSMAPPDGNDWVLYICRDVDATPPAAVSSLTVTAGQHCNHLVWANPSSSDFLATVIRWKTSGYPVSPTDGEGLVNLANLPGTTNTCVHSGLNAGATYYYTAFARDDEYHYSSGLQASAAPYDYRRVMVDLGTTDVEQGISNVQVSDGDTVAADIGGKNCRRNAVAGSDGYMYFSVADAYTYAGHRPGGYVTVEYYDTGSGTLTLQYDALADPYKSGGTIVLTDSGVWKRGEFQVSDAYFGNRQNGGADFRITGPAGATFYLNEASLADVSLTEQPPVIEPVGWKPDGGYVGTEYVRQLTLAHGRPLPSWTILQGPVGAFVDGSGQVSGWTPAPEDEGQTVSFQVRATNSQGSDTIDWQVRVSEAPLDVFEAEAYYSGHQMGTAIDGGWRVTTAEPVNQYSTYGPYTAGLIAGPLNARFWLRVDNSTADNNAICQLDVYDADAGAVITGPITITRQQWTAADLYQPFDLAFANPGGGHHLEFRTFYLGAARLDQDRVDIFSSGHTAPVVVEVSPDPDTAMIGVEYVRQLTLVQGYPAPTWSVISGPTGLNVNSSGLVYGWSPAVGQEGQSFTITVRATNSEGQDDESWGLVVRDSLAGMVFEDTLENSGKITGQRGSGLFSADGYTLTHSVSNCSVTGAPRSGDYVYYELGKSLAGGSWAAGSIEWDLYGLASGANVYPNIHEFIAVCDSYGISPNPAWDNASFYNSSLRSQQRRINAPGSTDKMKPSAYLSGQVFDEYSSVWEWNATTVYRFRITWSNGRMRWYRGIPGNTLIEVAPPGQFNYTGSWAPQLLHIQLGSTFRAYRTTYSGGSPGERYSLLRVFKTDLGDAATPPRALGALGDFDGDDDVDQSDFGYLQECSSGNGLPYEAGCAAADLDGDGDVDQADFAEFEACLGGADQPPGC